ncbi:hypothetical protein GCM10010104_26110 [Streptomyces indiaensis]|uniref:Uncharacterized protein n=1 Tax=Streptomyces indiaensis TaxID=284033 RepID=A0ABN3DH35_9ACTN
MPDTDGDPRSTPPERRSSAGCADGGSTVHLIRVNGPQRRTEGTDPVIRNFRGSGLGCRLSHRRAAVVPRHREKSS